MTFDIIEYVGESELHHGVWNDRVYLKEVHESDLGSIFERVADLTKNKKYGKILSKVPRWALEAFLKQGYQVEAEIPNLYGGQTDGYFLAGYPNKQRVRRDRKEERFIESVKTIALATMDATPKIPYKGMEVRRLGEKQLPELSRLHKKVFSTYPYPIFDTDYLRECLDGPYEFFGLYRDQRLTEAAIVDFNPEAKYAEIIDFAIPGECKGQNLSYHLIAAIKEEARKREVRTLFSSVRATSYGLNITLKKQGFQLGGTLVNNTRVGDSLESMNIWYFNG